MSNHSKITNEKRVSKKGRLKTDLFLRILDHSFILLQVRKNIRKPTQYPIGQSPIVLRVCAYARARE